MLLLFKNYFSYFVTFQWRTSAEINKFWNFFQDMFGKEQVLNKYKLLCYVHSTMPCIVWNTWVSN